MSQTGKVGVWKFRATIWHPAAQASWQWKEDERKMKGSNERKQRKEHNIGNTMPVVKMLPAVTTLLGIQGIHPY